MSPAPRRLLVLSFCVFALGSLAGCSGGSSSGGGGGTTTPTPAISSITPTKLVAGAGATTLTISGSGFVSTSVVTVGGTAEATTYVSATQLTATIPATQVASGAELSVAVSNGAISSTTPMALEVDNPAPAITSISPSTAVAGTASTVVTLTGTGFLPSTVVNANGSMRATTFINSTQVSVALPSTDFSAAGNLSLTAVNPTPGGGTSAPLTLAISNPAVGTIKLSPSTLNVGSTSPAVITVTGTGFVAASVVQVGGVARTTTFVNSTTLTFAATVADQATTANLAVTVTNAAPGGGTSPIAYLSIVVPPATPAITAITPNSIVVGSPNTSITITGTGFTNTTVAQWNGANLPTSYTYVYNGSTFAYGLIATVPASDLTSTGTASVTVSTPNANPPGSNAVTVSIVNPPVPTLSSISVTGGAVNTAAQIGVTGAGFTSQSFVSFNGTAVPTTFVSSTSLKANVPASAVSTTGVYPVSVTTPAPGGGTSANLYFTAWVPIPNNSMVYDPANGQFYLSVPSAAGAPYGNSIVPVDAVTGALGTPIPIGSEPNRMAITSDGQYLWVALDGAAAVRRVNLGTGTAETPFSIGGPGNSTETVSALAALPGSPDSVVVATYYTGYTVPTGTSLSIYDSGVQRSSVISFATYAPFPYALIVDGTKNEIYGPGQVYAGGYVTYNYDASGVSVKSTTNSSLNYATNTTDDVQLVGGRLYTSYGQADDPETGALIGTFYSSGTTPAEGSVAVDATLGKAFILEGSENAWNSSGWGTATVQLAAFNTADFSATSSAPLSLTVPLFRASFQYAGSTGARLTRWGSDGLAFRSTGGFVSLRTSLVQDLSNVSADLGVTLAVSGPGTTGTNSTYTTTVTNNGPSAATGVVLNALIPSSGVLVSVTSSAGSCSSTPAVCDLGTLANGGSATVTYNVLQTTAGSAAMTVQVSGSETDPVAANNEATASATITGSDYNLAPALTAISPAAIVSGASDTLITLSGTGFSSASVAMLNGSVLNTSYVSATQLSAIVPAADLSKLGWAAITVSSPSPGGGISGAVPLTVFSVLPLTATDIVYDPYSRDIIAGVGTGTSTVAGNSLVAIAPDTVSVSAPVPLSATPSRVVLSSDGQLLYALLPGSSTGSIAGFNMLTRQLGFTVSGFKATGYNTGLRDIAVQPGTNTTVAVDEGEYPGTSIFDIDPVAKTATRRGAATGTYTGTCLLFPNATSLFATDLYSSGGGLEIYSVTSSGLLNGSYPYWVGDDLQDMGCYKADGSLLVGQAGGVASLASGVPQQLGTFEGQSVLGNYGTGTRDFAPDASLGLAFLQPDPNDYSTDLDAIVSFDLQTFMQTSSLAVPFSSSESASGATGVEMVRWGQDGLAILSSGGNVYLLRGPAVVPQLLGTSSAATLSLSSVSTITHGTGNTLITLTGSNFLPGVAVSWNGSYRTTSILSPTQITVAIPASDLSSAGTASVVATNPGAPASNALQITIN